MPGRTCQWPGSHFGLLRRSIAAVCAAILAPATVVPLAHAKGAGAAFPSPQIDDSKVHDVGGIRTLVTNWGLVGSMPGSGQPYAGAPSAEWPAPGAAEYLWAGGLWVGAIKNGEPHVSTAVFASEFRPGRSAADRMYATHEGAVGGGRRPSLDADDDHDGRTDEDPLDGHDNDADGRIDEDFAAVSYQMFACEYADTDTAIVRGSPDHVPLEILVEQSSLAWATPLHRSLIGFDLKIINQGFSPLDNVYVGFFADCDIGLRSNLDPGDDDRAGFWEGRRTMRQGTRVRLVTASLAYMFDPDTDAGTAPGYIGFEFLGAADSQHPRPANEPVRLRNFRMFTARAGFEHGGEPVTDAQRYQVLSGAGPDSLPPPDPESGFRPPQEATRDDDYRVLISVGPFSVLDPGDTLSVQVAMVIGGGFLEMVDRAVLAKALYDGAWYDCDRDPTTGVAGREFPVCAPRDSGWVRTDLCDSLCDIEPPGTPGCFVRVPATGCEWVNADCAVEYETGVQTGVDGAECAVHWTTPATVPLAVQDLDAVAAGGAVHLAWRLADPSQVAAVFVLRATAPGGPFARLTERGLAPAAFMAFDDTSVENGRDYWYGIGLEDAAGRQAAAATVHVVAGGVETALALPVQQGPDAIRIAYRLRGPGIVDLAVFNAGGRRVRTLARGPCTAGSHLTVWDRRSETGARLVRGIYFIRLDACGVRAARKLVLVRE